MARKIKVEGFITRDMEVEVAVDKTAKELALELNHNPANVALFELNCDGDKFAMTFKNRPKGFNTCVGDCVCSVWEKIKKTL